MNYYIYKLKFVTPVRFGVTKGNITNDNSSDFTSDQIFASIFNEYVNLYSIDKAKKLLNDFYISDLFPFMEDKLYLPKPIMIFDSLVENKNKDRKIGKKIKYIQINEFNEYINDLKKGNDLLKYKLTKPFFKEVYQTKYNFSKEQTPYTVSGIQFYKNCGLYFIVSFNDEIKEEFDNIIRSLSFSGIGGKKSSGYGKFEIDEIIKPSLDIINSLNSNCKYKMLLSSVIPTDEEVMMLKTSNSFYSVISRSGFSVVNGNMVKKKTTPMLKSGSCMDFDIKGQIKEVNKENVRSIYRYAKALKWGIE